MPLERFYGDVIDDVRHKSTMYIYSTTEVIGIERAMQKKSSWFLQHGEWHIVLGLGVIGIESSETRYSDFPLWRKGW